MANLQSLIDEINRYRQAFGLGFRVLGNDTAQSLQSELANLKRELINLQTSQNYQVWKKSTSTPQTLRPLPSILPASTYQYQPTATTPTIPTTIPTVSQQDLEKQVAIRGIYALSLENSFAKGQIGQDFVKSALEQFDNAGYIEPNYYQDIAKAYPSLFEAETTPTMISYGGKQYSLGEFNALSPFLMQEIQNQQERELQTGQLARTKQLEFASGLYSGLTGGDTTENQALQTQYAQAWETNRNSLISQFTQPSDWISRWQVENQRNPYTLPQPQQWSDVVQREMVNVQNAEALEKTIRARRNDPADPLFYANLHQPKNEEEQLAAIAYLYAPQTARKKLQEAQIGLMQEQSANILQEGFAPGTYSGSMGWAMPKSESTPNPTTPPSPAWLPQYVEGQTAGQPIKQLPMRTPSGQQWGQTPWSVQQGLSGYLNWAGGRPMEDVISQMNMMSAQPVAGAGQTRWTPTRIR